MGGNDSLRISDIKDKNLRAFAKKFDVDDEKGVLKGKELINFNTTKEYYKPGSMVTTIKDLNVLRTPDALLNENNILTVIDNYAKENDGKNLFAALMKEDSITPEDRKNGTIQTFEILYNKVLATAKTDFQKEELKALKERFNQVVTEEIDDSWFEWSISTSEVEKIVKTMQKIHTESDQELAGEIYDHIDDNNFSYADGDFKYLLNSIDAGNAISVAQQVKTHKANKNGDSMLRILAQEYTTPFSDEEHAEKKAQIKNFVNAYFEAAGFKDSPYYKDAQKLLTSITDAWDTTSLVNTTDIEHLENIMDSLIINKPKDIAEKLYKIINDNSYAIGRTDAKILLDRISAANVNEVLAEFKKNGDKKSLYQMINEEWGDDNLRKNYMKRIITLEFQTTKFAKDKELTEHFNASLKNESIDGTELLLASFGKNKNIDYMSKTLFNQLSADEDNFDKEAVKYLLQGIDKSNVVKFLEAFNKLSNGTPITEYLQKKGGAGAEEYILSIADNLIEANSEKFENEEFMTTFGILKTDVKNYIRKRADDKEDISHVINSFLTTTPEDIAKNIESIADDKNGAADDISFKLWISRINKTNAREVIKAYKDKFDNETPINAIIEEYNSDVGARQSQVLHVLSSLVGELGEDKVNIGNIANFNTQLDDELFTFGPASADKLNKLLEKISAGIPEDGKPVEKLTTTTILKNVRPEIKQLSLGEKYGNFSWQYSNLKSIQSLEDIAQLTGLSVEYLKEMEITEGVRIEAYNCSSGKRTIGIGHNFHSQKGEESQYLENTELTTTEIYQILALDLIKAINKLQNNRGIDTSKLTQGQYEALVDVSFNAPGYMEQLSKKTNAAIALQDSGNKEKAKEAFDEAANEFNQQLSNSKIAAGLCKRRIRNIMRYCGVKNFKDLPDDSEAKKRIIILAKNGYTASPFYKEAKYINDICEIMGITDADFHSFEYPKGYKS